MTDKEVRELLGKRVKVILIGIPHVNVEGILEDRSDVLVQEKYKVNNQYFTTKDIKEMKVLEED